MYPVKLSDLKQRVLQLANLEGAAGFLDHPELTGMINRGLAKWWGLIVKSRFQGQFARNSFTFTTVAGTQLYPLPADFYEMISGDVYVSTSWKVNMRPYQEEDRNILQGPILIVAGWNGPFWYQLQGSNISFLVSIGATYVVTLNYIPVAPVLNGANDYFDSVNGLEEYIVIYAARKALFKDGQYEAMHALDADMADEAARISEEMPDRDAGAAEVVHDVVSQNAGWGPGFSGAGEGWP